MGTHTNAITRQVCIHGMAFFLGMLWAVPTERFLCTPMPSFSISFGSTATINTNLTNTTQSIPSPPISAIESEIQEKDGHSATESSTRWRRLSLGDLLLWPSPIANCPEGQVSMAAMLKEWNSDNLKVANTTKQGHTRIPSMVHILVSDIGQTSCVNPNEMNDWKEQFAKVKDRSKIFWHGPWMRDALIWESSWEEFPFLPYIRPCVNTDYALGALWSALTLYEYGGMAVLLEPSQLAWTARLVDQTFGELAKKGPHEALVWRTRDFEYHSQVLTSAPSPHPFPYLLVMSILERLFRTPLVAHGSYRHDPIVNGILTGFGAVNEALKQFMQEPYAKQRSKFNLQEKVWVSSSGKYTGLHGYQVTIARSKLERNETELPKRLTQWEFPGIERKAEAWPESCFHQLYRATGYNEVSTK